MVIYGIYSRFVCFSLNLPICPVSLTSLGFPGSSAGKESACSMGDLGLIPGLGRSPGEGNGYPLKYSGLKNFMDCVVPLVSINFFCTAAAKSYQSCPTLWDPIDGSPPGSRPWDSPGKNTGVGCHFLLQCMKVKSEREVSQSCPTLHDPMNCSLPGSSVRGIFQARVLEWGAIAFSFSSVYLVSICALLISSSVPFF